LTYQIGMAGSNTGGADATITGNIVTSGEVSVVGHTLASIRLYRLIAWLGCSESRPRYAATPFPIGTTFDSRWPISLISPAIGAGGRGE
jgi:hypothetical protein